MWLELTTREIGSVDDLADSPKVEERDELTVANVESAAEEKAYVNLKVCVDLGIADTRYSPAKPVLPSLEDSGTTMTTTLPPIDPDRAYTRRR